VTVMKMNRTARVSIAVGTILLVATGVANAYWSSRGSGSGNAGSGKMTITTAALAGESPQNVLYPGGTADAIVKIGNPNAFTVHVVAITATGAAQAGNNCTPTGITFTAPTDFTAAQFTLPANQSTTLDLAGAVAMNTTSASTCQGQTFSLPVTVTVQK